jgi:hypothetical protein
MIAKVTKLGVLVVVLMAILLAPGGSVALAGRPAGKCTTIQDGLVDSKGNPLVLGFDQWGYNYQAHIFNGLYENYSRPDPPVTESDTFLQMKWNDAWLSNKDCDGDGLLDRHYGYDSYIGSGAWLTNHMWGTYEDEENGETCKWQYFVKIVAVPADAVESGGVWYTADGTEIGPVIWGSFAIIQEVYNDPCAGEHGLYYKSPATPGLGAYKP